MLEFGKPAELGKRMKALLFKNTETGETAEIAVKDNYPQMGDVHIEGRRTVEVSMELMVELMAAAGYGVVDPATGELAKKKEEV